MVGLTLFLMLINFITGYLKEDISLRIKIGFNSSRILRFFILSLLALDFQFNSWMNYSGKDIVPINFIYTLILVFYFLYIFVLYVYSQNEFLQRLLIFIGSGIYLMLFAGNYSPIVLISVMGIGNFVFGVIYLNYKTEKWKKWDYDFFKIKRVMSEKSLRK